MPITDTVRLTDSDRRVALWLTELDKMHCALWAIIRLHNIAQRARGRSKVTLESNRMVAASNSPVGNCPRVPGLILD